MYPKSKNRKKTLPVYGKRDRLCFLAILCLFDTPLTAPTPPHISWTRLWKDTTNREFIYHFSPLLPLVIRNPRAFVCTINFLFDKNNFQGPRDTSVQFPNPPAIIECQKALAKKWQGIHFVPHYSPTERKLFTRSDVPQIFLKLGDCCLWTLRETSSQLPYKHWKNANNNNL